MMTLTGEELAQLASRLTIDLTTTGRKSGNPRRIEIWWFCVDGRFIITGTPGRRDWLANIMANPEVVVHVDGHDLDATAMPVEDREFRHAVFTQPKTRWYSTQAELGQLVETAPMVEIEFSD